MKKMVLPSIKKPLVKTNSTSNPSPLPFPGQSQSFQPYKLITPNKPYTNHYLNQQQQHRSSSQKWDNLSKSSNFPSQKSKIAMRQVAITKHNSSHNTTSAQKSFVINNNNQGPPFSLSSSITSFPSQPKTFYPSNSNSSQKQFNSPKQCPLCSAIVESYRLNLHMSNHPSKIFDWLYLGSYSNASGKNEMHSLNIKYVLNCAIECRDNYPKDFTYCHLKLCDRPNFRICLYFNQAADFISNAREAKNGGILVHCQMGISRSTTCVIAYMIRDMNFTAVEALGYVKKRRKVVFPNYGFMEQLIKYEKIISAKRMKKNE